MYVYIYVLYSESTCTLRVSYAFAVSLSCHIMLLYSTRKKTCRLCGLCLPVPCCLLSSALLGGGANRMNECREGGSCMGTIQLTLQVRYQRPACTGCGCGTGAWLASLVEQLCVNHLSVCLSAVTITPSLPGLARSRVLNTIELPCLGARKAHFTPEWNARTPTNRAPPCL